MEKVGEILKNMLKNGYTPGDYLNTTQEYVTVHIKKPMGNKCSIDKRKLDEAISKNTLIHLIVDGVGTRYIDPKEWITNAYKVEERFIMNPDVPMVFVYGVIPSSFKYSYTKEDITSSQLTLL